MCVSVWEGAGGLILFSGRNRGGWKKYPNHKDMFNAHVRYKKASLIHTEEDSTHIVLQCQPERHTHTHTYDSRRFVRMGNLCTYMRMSDVGEESYLKKVLKKKNLLNLRIFVRIKSFRTFSHLFIIPNFCHIVCITDVGDVPLIMLLENKAYL